MVIRHERFNFSIMIKKIIIILMLVPLLAVPTFCFAQHFESLFDNDSTYDWGWCILNRPDGNYFVVGWSENEITGDVSTFNTVVSADGSTIISKNNIQMGSSGIYPGGSLDAPGQIVQLSDGGYIIPMTIQTPNHTYLNSAAGFIKYNSLGSTLFLKNYTDTSKTFDYIYNCAVMPDGGYIGGGGRGDVAPHNLGFIIRTDSLGDTLWTHTYSHDTGQWAEINTIISLSDGRIVAGAMSGYYAFDGSDAYTHNTPWFMVLDKSGNVMRDTVYGNRYGGGGGIYKDRLGGYIHLGAIDTFETRFPEDFQNFPNYIAHLDTIINTMVAEAVKTSEIEGEYLTWTSQNQKGNY
jgi:hypothetical protein